MTGNNGDERDPNSLYIGRRLSYIAFMVLGAFVIVPWENPSVSHNYFWFYRFAMEICLKLADWDGVERYAEALADYTRPEPLPWSDFHIARARALSAHGRGKRDEATMDELQLLCDQAERAGLRLAVPDLESAIAKA